MIVCVYCKLLNILMFLCSVCMCAFIRSFASSMSFAFADIFFVFSVVFKINCGVLGILIKFFNFGLNKFF